MPEGEFPRDWRILSQDLERAMGKSVYTLTLTHELPPSEAFYIQYREGIGESVRRSFG